MTKYTGLLIFALIVLASCEGGTTYTKSIDNRSSETITIGLYAYYGNNETNTINPSESKAIFWDDQMGSFVDDNYSCTQEIDSIVLAISKNKILKKDII